MKRQRFFEIRPSIFWAAVVVFGFVVFAAQCAQADEPLMTVRPEALSVISEADGDITPEVYFYISRDLIAAPIYCPIYCPIYGPIYEPVYGWKYDLAAATGSKP